jgi:hypothetical protein
MLVKSQASGAKTPAAGSRVRRNSRAACCSRPRGHEATWASAMLCLLRELCDWVHHQRCCCARAGAQHAAPQRAGTAGQQAAVLACMHVLRMQHHQWEKPSGMRGQGLSWWSAGAWGPCCPCCLVHAAAGAALHAGSCSARPTTLLALPPGRSMPPPGQAAAEVQHALQCCKHRSAARATAAAGPALQHSSHKLLLHAPASLRLPRPAPSSSAAPHPHPFG